jgi:hypothetical protein
VCASAFRSERHSVVTTAAVMLRQLIAKCTALTAGFVSQPDVCGSCRHKVACSCVVSAAQATTSGFVLRSTIYRSLARACLMHHRCVGECVMMSACHPSDDPCCCAHTLMHACIACYSCCKELIICNQALQGGRALLLHACVRRAAVCMHEY